MPDELKQQQPKITITITTTIIIIIIVIIISVISSIVISSITSIIVSTSIIGIIIIFIIIIILITSSPTNTEILILARKTRDLGIPPVLSRSPSARRSLTSHPWHPIWGFRVLSV